MEGMPVGAVAATRPRSTALDAMRGLIMIVMALDHVRDFFHADATKFQPDDLAQTTAALFFTRWITHFCAPFFAFSAGAGAYLWSRTAGRTPADLTSYLWKRGLWLVVLELTVVRVGLFLNPFAGPIVLTILWALGWSMVSLAFLSRVPLPALGVVSTAVIALHNTTDSMGISNPVWTLLHRQGLLTPGVIVAYPLIPWMFVMSAGFWFGQVLDWDADARQRLLVRVGAGLTAAFVVIRAINVYGDPQRWSPQVTPLFTLLSFLRCSKYPPSLDFLLMTLGPALLMIAWFYRIQPSPGNPLVTIGRVPLFYFLVHLVLAHILTIPFAMGAAGAPENRHSLATVYVAWLIVIGVMYPLCKWFGRVKARGGRWWLSYL